MTKKRLSGDRTLAETTLIPIARAWAKTSVNAVIFRQNSVVTFETEQYAAFYDDERNVVLAKRKLGTETWELQKTQYKGDAKDAHNSISLMVDGRGYLHLAWDHHVHPLRYCRSKAPRSLELSSERPMTARKESSVTYPGFYRFDDGNLLFLYRHGASGDGDVMINHYDLKTAAWSQVQDAFIDGEGERNAYWQLHIDSLGTIHLSWVWRESNDVASNHDICYARSHDEGKTWETSAGKPYDLPITASNAEYACRVPENSELINQTSMYADARGNPFIATYWRSEGTDVPQYRLVYHDGGRWRVQQISARQKAFTLRGGGTKRIPISRPQIVIGHDDTDSAYLIFRDAERGNRASVAVCSDLRKGVWQVEDLSTLDLGMWEPSYDTELWRRSRTLHLFLQPVGQGDGEKAEDVEPQWAAILEWTPRG